MSLTVGITELAAFLAIVSLLGGWVWRLSSRLTEAKATTDTAADKAEKTAIAVQAARLEIRQLEGSIHTQAVMIAREYVSQKTLERMEEKLITAIDKLGERFDKILLNTAPH